MNPRDTGGLVGSRMTKEKLPQRWHFMGRLLPVRFQIRCLPKGTSFQPPAHVPKTRSENLALSSAVLDDLGLLNQDRGRSGNGMISALPSST